jgi:hypothetical protein
MAFPLTDALKAKIKELENENKLLKIKIKELESLQK